MTRKQIMIDTEKCIGCGRCSHVCALNNLLIQNNKAVTALDECILCGQCFAICPKKAITMVGCGQDQMEKTEDICLNPEDVLNTIRYRRSIRNFKETKIPYNVIHQILEAGRLTHTAKNMQDVSFIVLDNEKKRIEKMAVHLFQKIKPIANIFSPMAANHDINDDFFFFNAPIVILVLAKNKTNGLLAAQNMEFVAEANGLGVLYSGYFTMAANASRNIKKAISMPRGKKVSMTLVIGYPNVKFLRSTPHQELQVRYL